MLVKLQFFNISSHSRYFLVHDMIGLLKIIFVSVWDVLIFNCRILWILLGTLHFQSRAYIRKGDVVFSIVFNVSFSIPFSGLKEETPSVKYLLCCCEISLRWRKAIPFCLKFHVLHISTSGQWVIIENLKINLLLYSSSYSSLPSSVLYKYWKHMLFFQLLTIVLYWRCVYCIVLLFGAEVPQTLKQGRHFRGRASAGKVCRKNARVTWIHGRRKFIRKSDRIKEDSVQVGCQ